MKRAGIALICAGAVWASAGVVTVDPTDWHVYEWRASTFAGSTQDQAALDALPDGRVIVVWSSRRQHDGHAGVFAQRFDAKGIAIGAETPLALWSGGHQTEPVVAADGQGGLWIAWQSFGQNGYAGTIIARRFDRQFRGGPEIAVSDRTEKVHEFQPAIATWPDGRAVVIWTARTGPKEPLKVFGRILGADGQPVGPEFAVGVTGAQDELVPSVTTRAGGFAVAYSVFTDDRPDGIRLQRFGPDAGQLGDAVRVSGPRGPSQIEPALAATADGYVVAWHDAETDGDGYGILARRFDVQGVPLSEPFIVNSTRAGSQNGAAVAVAPDGRYAIAWNSADADGLGLFAQMFNADGARSGGEFRLNRRTRGEQALHAATGSRRIAFGPGGELLCAWSGDAGCGDKTSANVTMLSPRGLDLAGGLQGVTGDMPAAAPTAAGDELATPHIPPTFDPRLIETGERDFRDDVDAFGFTAILNTGWTPPDPHMAVGPAHIVVMTNGAIAAFQKNGTKDFQQIIEGASGFWGSLGATGFVFDPEVLYDELSGRFFAMAAEAYAPPNQSKSYVLIAVSDDANPNGTWYKYRFETSGLAGNLFDSPNIGVDANVVYVTGDGFGLGAVYPVYTFDKASLLAGVPPAVQRSLTMPTSTQSAGYSPVSFDNPPALYMCEHAESNPATTVRLIALRDPLGAPYFTTITLSVPSYRPPESPQSLGSSQRVSTFDARFWSVSYRNGSLWATHHVDSTRVRARWYEFRMNGWPTSGQNPQLVQSGEIDPGGTSRTFFTSISTNAAGDAAITCARCSPTEYFSMLSAVRLSTDPLNTFRQFKTEITSTGAYTSSRWGDYSEIEPDPADPTLFWAHHEYAQSNSWRTWVARVALPFRPGDMNCDGAINFDDINPFVLALSDPAGYQVAFPNCNILNGDINNDGLVNFDDINPFVALLTSPG